MPHFSGHQSEAQARAAAEAAGIPFRPSSPTVPTGQTAEQRAATFAAAGVTPITGADLTPNAPPVVTPTEPIPAPTVQPIASLATPVAGDVDDTLGQLETAVSDVSFLDREAAAASQLATQTEAQQQRIIEINEQFQQLNVQRAGALDVAETRNVLQPFAEGEAGRRQRADILQQMNLNIEKAAIQGQISLATQTINRKVDLEFAEDERDLNRARANVIANFDSFTGKDKKRAEALLIQIDGDLSALKSQKDARKDIETAIAEAINKGLSAESQRLAQQCEDILCVSRIVTNELGFEQEGAPFTLGKGQVRFDSAGNVIAEGLPEGLTFQTQDVGGRKIRFGFDAQGNIVSQTDLGASKTGVEKLTGTQRVAAGFALRAEDAGRIITEIGGQFTGAGTRLGFIPEAFKTEDRKSLEQAERNFVNAILRRESGAAIAPSEFESAQKQYFAQRGDTTAILEQKARNRQVVVQALRLEAGDAFTQLKATLPPLQEKVRIGGIEYEVGTIIQNASGQRAKVNADGTLTFI